MIVSVCIAVICFTFGFLSCLRIQSVLVQRKGFLYRIAKLFHLIQIHQQFSSNDISAPGHKDAEALYRRGRICQSGRGQKQDLAEARVWYRKAAKQGHLRAQLELAAISARGPAILRDPAEAAHWWTVAAELGDEYAQYELGLCYAAGNGVKKSHAEAIHWWQKAAQQGEMHSLCAIGDCYANGFGVKQDYSEAVRIWKKAAEAGSVEAQEKLRLIHQ